MKVLLVCNKNLLFSGPYQLIFNAVSTHVFNTIIIKEGQWVQVTVKDNVGIFYLLLISKIR